MTTVYLKCRRRWLIIVTMTLLPWTAPAQFQVFQWCSFEDGSMPAESFVIGTAPDKMLEIVDLTTVRGMPPAFYNPLIAEQVGRHALRLRANPPGVASPGTAVGLCLGNVFSRDELGAEGRALFQADFFLPEKPPLPNLAVMALAPDPDRPAQTGPLPALNGTFIRFGLTLNSVPYASLSEKGKSRPTLFLQDRDLIPHLPKPGWHRFTLVLTHDQVYCYIDGRGTVFSPSLLGEMREAMVGVVLTEGKLSYDCYLDNISVQVTREKLPVPESPYGDGWSIPAGLAAREGAGAPAPHAVRDLRWLPPLAAWRKAQETNKPFLLLFCAPGLSGSDRVETMFSTVTGAQRFLDRVVPARVDVNQLQGSALAQKYGVFKVPTLLLISPDGQSHRRCTPAKHETWDEIAAKLQ